MLLKIFWMVLIVVGLIGGILYLIWRMNLKTVNNILKERKENEKINCTNKYGNE